MNKKLKEEKKDLKEKLAESTAEVKLLKKQLEGAKKEEAEEKKGSKKGKREKEEVCVKECKIGNVWSMETGGGVECGQCKKWFHFSCVGIDVAIFNKRGAYACPHCSDSKKKRKLT